MTIFDDLSQLRLHYLAENLDNFVAKAKSASMPYEAFVHRMAELELVERSRRGIERRLKESKIGRFTPIQDFDWNWPKEVSREQIESLFTKEFLESRQNLILAGPQGLGKTMIARNLGYYAVTAGLSCYFTTASKLALDLGTKDSQLALQKKLRFYESRDFLIIDEIGYLSFDHRAADFIFEIVNRRYEKSAIVLTTNLSFKDWGTVFSRAPCVTAMIDRLTHHARIIKIGGDSFRVRESKSRKERK